MPGTAWRIVRDYDRGRLQEVYVVCPNCWSTEEANYRLPVRRGWMTEVKVIAPQRLSPGDDECHTCGAHPEKAA